MANDVVTEERRDAWAVSIEVDGRQKYLFEADKLQEMVGASAIMRQMAERKPNEGSVYVFQPASGEIRAWSTKRNELAHFAWKLREWLTDRGVEHTAVLLHCRSEHFTCDKTKEQAEAASKNAQLIADVDPAQNEPAWPDLAWVHRSLTSLARKVKDAKPGSDARPTCSLFAACRIHGFDAANEWMPKEKREPRRALRGYRARAKFDARQKDRTRFIDRDVRAPLQKRCEAVLSGDDDRKLRKWASNYFAPIGDDTAGYQRAITIGELICDPAEWLDDDDATDQYVALVCADGDGMGRLFTGLDWNLAAWGDTTGMASGFGTLPPWERNREFSQALDGAVRAAFRDAVAEVTLPDAEALKRLREATESNGRFIIPVLPQLLGGDDLWTIARKDVALPLCRSFAERVPQQMEECEIINQGMALSEKASDEPVKLTMSQGIAFAKAGHPVHAMIEAAESLLNSAKALRKGQTWSRTQVDEGCIDWHWIESSLSETVAEARARGTAYKDPDTGDLMLLTTRPWKLSEAEQLECAAEMFRSGVPRRKSGVPRRKREQLDDILRRGHVLSLVAWEAWWKRLRRSEQSTVEAVSKALPEAWRLPAPSDARAGGEARNWGKQLTISPWILVRTDGDQRYYVTPLLDLLALDNLASPIDDETKRERNGTGEAERSAAPAGKPSAGDAHA